MRALILLFLFAAGDDPLAPVRDLMHHRDFREAEAALLEGLSEKGDDLAALKLLAEVYLRVEEPASALAALDRAAKLAPSDPDVIAGRWEAGLAKDGWTAEARQALSGEIAAFLAAGEEPFRLSAAYLGYYLLDDKEARRDLRERIFAAGLAPPEAVEGDLFENAVTERDAPKRETLCREYLTRYPDTKQSNLVREVLLGTLREDRAKLMAEADAMLAADPENRRVRAALGRWLLETAPPDPVRAAVEIGAALELLDTPREIDRPEMLGETRGRYFAWLGRARLLSGDATGAWLALTRAAGLLSHDVNTCLWLAEAAEKLGRSDQALDARAWSLVSGESPVTDPEVALRARVLSGPAPRFTDVTQAAGLGEARGSRVAWGDADGDGRPDLLLGGSQLWLCRGGTFVAAPDFPKSPGARGGLFADFDGDGDADVLVFRTGGPVLLGNDGSGGFADRTPEVLAATGDLLTESASIFDFDGDGRPDFYLANYERPPNPPWARGTPDRLFRNLGDFRFEDATKRVSGVSAEPMCGRGTVAADFDGDGDVDLYVANYRLDPDFLLVNRGDGRLVNEARARGVEGECDGGAFGHGIGPAAGDLDGDGHLDFVVGNLAHPRYIGFSDVTRLFLNSGPPEFRFRDVFPMSGVRFEETHSNATLADFDLDGDLDLFLTSVYVGRRSFLYRNDGGGKFTDITYAAGVRVDNGWGAAVSDFDGDGDPDLAVGSGSGFRLFRNDGPGGKSLSIRVAPGTRVTVEAEGYRVVREVSAGTGTGCQDYGEAVFGTGDREGPFLVTVRWPGGNLQRIHDLPCGRYALTPNGNPEELNEAR
ncbi:MAG: FG-GAP-like repeat-containing protein [Planctomycetes bacterium]|nr:FG-GAP-like repeat-containing protein [Planctomycetota bacterium]